MCAEHAVCSWPHLIPAAEVEAEVQFGHGVWGLVLRPHRPRPEETQRDSGDANREHDVKLNEPRALNQPAA